MQKQFIIAALLGAGLVAAFAIVLVASQQEEGQLDSVYTEDLKGKVQPTLLDPSRTNYILRMETIIGPVGDRYFRAKVDAMRSAIKKPECDYIVAASVDAYRSSNRDLTFGIQCKNGAVLSISESRENNTVLEAPSADPKVELPPVPVIVPERLVREGRSQSSEATSSEAADSSAAKGVASVRQTAAALCGALGEEADPNAQTITVGAGADGSLNVDCAAP